MRYHKITSPDIINVLSDNKLTYEEKYGLWTFWLSCDKECPSCGGKTHKAGNDYHCPKCRKLWHMNVWGILKEREEDKNDNHHQ